MSAGSAPTALTVPTGSGDAPPAGDRSPRPRWRPRRSTLVIGAAAVLAVVGVALLSGGPRTEDPLDPDNPGPGGARAVARVLGDAGVEVDVARGAAALADARVDGSTTLLVVSPDLLGQGALDALRDGTGAATLVVAGAGPGVSEALGAPLPSRERVTRPRPAACDSTLLRGLELEVENAWAYPVAGCSTGPGGTLVARTDDGLVLLGAEEALANDQVTRADNAAVVLRLLGQQPRLVWYVPDLADLTADDGVALRTLLPRWIEPGLYVLGLTVLGLVLWRGRRLGPLATEGLPVVVRAAETTHSLGRLYRRSQDRGHAAPTLRTAARTRLAQHLQLGRTAGADEVVGAVARRLGRRPDEVAALLSPDAPAPTTDHDLVTLAADLAALEREVGRP